MPGCLSCPLRNATYIYRIALTYRIAYIYRIALTYRIACTYRIAELTIKLISCRPYLQYRRHKLYRCHPTAPSKCVATPE